MERLKKIDMILVIILAITILATKANAETHNTYNVGMKVIQLDYLHDIVTCETSTGFVFEFYGCEDYYMNDIIICVMDNNRTKSIIDDKIIDTKYSGFSLDESPN